VQTCFYPTLKKEEKMFCLKFKTSISKYIKAWYLSVNYALWNKLYYG